MKLLLHIGREITHRLGLLETYRQIRHRRRFLDPYWRQNRPLFQAFYQEWVPNKSLVFDVGANLGDKAQVFLDVGATVIAVEPSPYCHSLLVKRFKDNPKVTVVNKALGETPSKTTLRFSKANHAVASTNSLWLAQTTKSGRFKSTAWNEEIDVNVDTLDHLIAQFGEPYFCKIDVEGSEVAVLRGLSKKIPVVAFEYTLPEFHDQALTCIKKLCDIADYKFNYSPNESMKFALSSWISAAEMIRMLSEPAAKLDAWGDIYGRMECHPLDTRTVGLTELAAAPIILPVLVRKRIAPVR